MGVRAGGRAVNVIGRGPSVTRHIEALRRDDADNWACGTAWAWCRDNGIKAAFVCADANPRLAAERYVSGVEVAILASQCDPALFAALEGADVKVADKEKSNLGSTSAVMAMVLGASADGEVRLYGCEGSYGETTHADEDIDQPYLMTVRANGQVFRTNPQMLIQSEEIAWIMRIAKPGIFLDRSGGLLGALIASDGEWDLLSYRNAPPHIQSLLDSEHRRAAE